MTLHNFLYTRSRPERYYRHIAFWICTYLPFLLFNIIGVYAKPYDISVTDFCLKQISNFPQALVDIGFTYLIAYFLIPLYLRTRNTPLLVTGIAGAITIAFMVKGFFWYRNGAFASAGLEKVWLASWFMITGFLNDGSIMRCGLFLCCLMLRDYYNKSQIKATLVQENATAELQLLKAQVHPHFLFNTLNNIYSFSLKKSPVAPSLVSKLSDTLQYMITECEAPLVPLSKELKMVRDYIELESVRYGSRLTVNIEMSGNANDKMIAPLLLIPLVENSFKHGTSQVIDHAWIDLKIAVLDDDLQVTLRNSKPEERSTQERKNGIGLKNVQKRLQLLYPGKHQLIIDDKLDRFEVFISIPILHNLTIANGRR